MTPYPRNANVAAYQRTATQGAVATADPHGLVLMLMNGAMERMAAARGCIERREIVRKAKLLHTCVRIIGELRGTLNMADGGTIAQNLSELYDYMARRLIIASAENNAGCVTEVMSLLGEIRGAWIAIGPQVQQAAASASAPAASAATAA
ncbi:MAG TPA: flagellar export chaperone FliS [Steroidobacteraceae bacterium]|nr:flagellar export chaperone FliS [Steroidobacteraceae bacterium]